MRERKASVMAVDDGGRWRAYFAVMERNLKAMTPLFSVLWPVRMRRMKTEGGMRDHVCEALLGKT